MLAQENLAPMGWKNKVLYWFLYLDHVIIRLYTRFSTKSFLTSPLLTSMSHFDFLWKQPTTPPVQTVLSPPFSSLAPSRHSPRWTWASTFRAKAWLHWQQLAVTCRPSLLSCDYKMLSALNYLLPHAISFPLVTKCMLTGSINPPLAHLSHDEALLLWLASLENKFL